MKNIYSRNIQKIEDVHLNTDPKKSSSLKKEGNHMKQKNSMKEIYREGSGFKYFLLCILI